MTDISALEAYAGQLSEAAALSKAASEKQHGYIHGDDQSDVGTESGPVPSIAKQARLSAEATAGLRGEMSQGDGLDLSGFERKPYSLNRAIRSAGDLLNVHDVFLQEFAHHVVDDDWSYAFFRAFEFGGAFPGPGVGGRLRLGGGRFGLRRQVDIPFGWSIIGASSDFYGTTLAPLPDFVGEWMCKFTSPSTSYNNGHWDLVSMDMGNMAGVGCLLFEAAYRSSSIKNSTFRGVASDAPGLIVRPATHEGAMSVCESVLISDVYVIKDSSADQTVNGIQLYTLQESTLINVKCFHAGNPAPVRGGYPIYIEDSRGIKILSGGVVGGLAGIHLHAKNRNCTGISIDGMTWENNTNCIKTSGENGFLVAGVHVPNMRVEYPAAALALDLQGCSGGKFVIGSGNVKATADCNNVIIETTGVGTRDIAVGAQITFLDRGNAINKAYRISPFLDVYGASSPMYSLSVNGRTGSWNWNWNANAASDSGARFRSPLGNTILTFTDAGFGPLSKFQSRVYINADNTPSQHWEVNGRSGTWHWEWAASATDDYGYRLVGPDGRTVFSARDAGGISTIGFFDGVRAAKQDIGGSLAASDPVLKRVVQVLAAYGLISNSTTG
ncbi:hypothetical protein [Pseudomonas laurylsulfatiphila]|uniref:hypothetical protein n=1 Tax=Pseudomonas laurylsulfatiphila TaxID=2011015 RepID=UPI003D237B85